MPNEWRAGVGKRVNFLSLICDVDVDEMGGFIAGIPSNGRLGVIQSPVVGVPMVGFLKVESSAAGGRMSKGDGGTVMGT